MSSNSQLPAPERKRMLVLQGQVFRSGLALAQHDVRAALETKSLMRHALGDVFETGADAARKLLSLQNLLNDGRLSILLPLVGKGFGLLARRSVLRPLALAVVAGGLGYAGFRFWQQRRGTGAQPQSESSGVAEAEV